MNKIKRAVAIIIVVVIVLAIFIPVISTPAYADTNKWDESAYYINAYTDIEGSNAVRVGGINSLDGVQAESREETESLERYLNKNNYLLINTKDKEISNEEFDLLKIIHFPYSEVLDEDNDFYFSGKNYKVYVYKPSLECALKEYNINGKINIANEHELNISTVKIDYFMWYTVERIGQTMEDEEINENLPEIYQENAGFIEFLSPINAEIVLHLIDNDYYYRIYIAKGKTLVKLRSEHYEITDINAVDTYYDEELLTNNNYFVVWQNPEYDPIVVNLTQLVARDHIPDRDISGKPNCAWVWEDVDIEDIGDIIVEEENDKSEKPFSWGWIVMILALAGMGVGFYIFMKKSR